MRSIVSLLAMSAFILPIAAVAQDNNEAVPAEESSSSQLDQWLEGDYMTGDWGGLRTDLQDAGIRLRWSYNVAFMGHVRGGQDTNNGCGNGGSWSGDVLFNFEKMDLIPGGEFFLKYGGSYGGRDNIKIGSIFPARGLGKDDGCATIDIKKWWWRQRLFENRLEFRIGRIETGGDLFDVGMVAEATDENFMNGALEGNPAIPHMNGFGAYLSAWPTDWLNLRAAVLDATGEGGTAVTDTAFSNPSHYGVFYELGIRPEYLPGVALLPGIWRVGGWYDPTDLNKISNRAVPQSHGGHTGFYVGLDQMFCKENNVADDEQGLSAYVRYGYAPRDYYEIPHFWSLGAQYMGAIPTRDDDIVGLAMAQGILSRNFRSMQPQADRETVYEMYYRIQVAPWLFITPDVQFFTNPGGDKNDNRDAAVVGLRMRVLF